MRGTTQTIVRKLQKQVPCLGATLFEAHPKEMIHASMLPRVKKRPRPVEAGARGQEEVKFNEVTVYLVERKMGSSRRSFLTSLARSKGFRVEYVLR